MYATIQILREEISRKQNLLERSQKNREESIAQLINESQTIGRLNNEIAELQKDLDLLQQQGSRPKDYGAALNQKPQGVSSLSELSQELKSREG